MVFCSLWGLLWLKVKWYLHRVIWKGISHGRFQNQAKYLICLQNFVSMILKNSIRSGEKKLRLRENISWSFPGSCKSWWQPIKTKLATILVALHHQSSQKHSVVAPGRDGITRKTEAVDNSIDSLRQIGFHIFFCSTSLPLTITRWFNQHIQAFHTPKRSAVE